MTLSERLALPLLLVVSFCLLALGIWMETGITGKDEYWVTMRTPMEMMERGSFWTLWLNGEVRLKKPPVVYWVIYGFYSLFGVSTWAARLSGVLAGTALVGGTVVLYRNLFAAARPWASILAGALVLATVGLGTEGRRAMLDVPLAASTLWSLVFLVAYAREGGAWRAALSGAFLGLALMVKGPPCLIFFGAGALAALAMRVPKPSRRWPLHVGLAVVVLLLVAGPWPFSMWQSYPTFFQTVGDQVGTKRFGAVDWDSPLSALGGALGLVFPWSLLALAAIVVALRRGPRPARWLALSCVLSLVPFLFMKAFERYLIPLMPFIACLVAYGWHHRFGGVSRVLLRIGVGLMVLVLGAIVAMFAWFKVAPIGVLIVALLLVLSVVVVWRWPNRPLVVVGVVALTLHGAFGGLYPYFGMNGLPEDIAAQVAGKRLWSFESQPSMLSVRLGQSVRHFEGQTKGMQAGDWVFVSETDEAKLDERHPEVRRYLKPVYDYQTMYSRKNFLRFTRKGSGPEENRRAFEERDLKPLRTTIRAYEWQLP